MSLAVGQLSTSSRPALDQQGVGRGQPAATEGLLAGVLLAGALLAGALGVSLLLLLDPEDESLLLLELDDESVVLVLELPDDSPEVEVVLGLEELPEPLRLSVL